MRRMQPRACVRGVTEMPVERRIMYSIMSQITGNASVTDELRSADTVKWGMHARVRCAYVGVYVI